MATTTEDFAGKVALVTGGASGIGKAVVFKLAERGAHVGVCDLNLEGAQAVAAEAGNGAVAIQLDVTDTASVRAGVEKAVEELGVPDVLVNVAGWDQMMRFLETDEAFWDKIIAINYRGVLATCHAVLPLMVERGSGAVVNVASEAGRSGSSGEVVYSGAKAAVIAFSKAVAREVARYGVRVNVVTPGLTQTPFLQRNIDEGHGKLIEAMVRATPLRRPGQPEEVAEAILFLASDRAAYTTGETLSVSGGLVMM